MPEYDGQQFDPPAPVARVIVRTLDHTRSVPDVAMLVDSGADVTLIPQFCAERLGLVSNIETGFFVRGFDGSPITADVVEAEIVFLERNFRGRFLLVTGQCGILGRNVLNNLALLFDGPRRNWREINVGE